MFSRHYSPCKCQPSSRKAKRRKIAGWPGLAAIVLSFPVAIPAAELETVVVTATREPQPSFDLPVSISNIDGDLIQSAHQEINLSESLSRVPGLIVQNRQNYAQDLQISIRGFGARSTFGVRGIRLYADGIPATMPDGQGQVANFDLGSAGRIEVLRGPFSALYGNSSGGVLAFFTEDAPPESTITGTVTTAGFGTQRYALKATGRTQQANYVADLSHFETDGFRDHSAASRDTGNVKLRYEVSERSRLTLIANILKSDADDPLGLTLAQWQSDPQQPGTNALSFNTRKAVSQQQLGLNYESNFRDADSFSSMVYAGHRTTLQYQSIPAASQSPATHSGGVINLNRDYGGLDTHWTHTTELMNAPLLLTAGLNFDQLNENRKGYQNFIGSQLGVQGTLRRNESNTVLSFDQYLQLQWEPGDQWLLMAGARNSVVKFTSDDHYIVTGNGDDSGHRTYTATSPVAGLTYRISENLNIYASYGKGFETPAFNELAYRSTDGTQTGLNLGLEAAHSQHYETGIKSRFNEHAELDIAMFRSDTQNELAVLANSGGRAVYQNVARTRREGAELEFSGGWGRVSTALNYTWLKARYEQGFTTCTSLPCSLSTVLPDSRIPGIPSSTAYAELTWRNLQAGLYFALEGHYVSSLFTDDLNRSRTTGYAVTNFRTGFEQETAHWNIKEYMAIDNLENRKYIGSVIVNETNQRYFEPAPGRSWLIGVKISSRM